MADVSVPRPCGGNT